MGRALAFMVTIFLSTTAWAAMDEAELARLSQWHSPRRLNTQVLLIEGKIDSHIYDYLSREARSLREVRVVELNSFGGNAEWSLEIARQIRQLGWTTRLSSGHVCASACVNLFAAGREREAAPDTSFGIHAARLGARYSSTFEGACFVDMNTGPVFQVGLRNCQAFIDEWYAKVSQMTDLMFSAMEESGVSPLLRKTYYALSDDPDWAARYNVFKKPDWVLEARAAVKYNLVTRVLE